MNKNVNIHYTYFPLNVFLDFIMFSQGDDASFAYANRTSSVGRRARMFKTRVFVLGLIVNQQPVSKVEGGYGISI
jgi:hypothetical protein